MAELNELIDRKMRLLEARRLIEFEINLVEAEIAKMGSFRKTPLSPAFFDKKIVPMLRSAGDRGMTSSQMHRELELSGAIISKGAFRTFLSRNKERGLLEVVSIATGPSKWRLTK